ncbi:MAG: hypothetical protein JSV62_06425 [Promethearchaeota archaeon]|nr:MAG: hypothetical protein JSV62_06425 [Candidatus Lokiarchaeota archaeon]
MVEFIKGKLLIGPIVAIVGSVMLLSGGILGLFIPEIQIAMALFPILYLTFVLPIILGIVGIAGAVLVIVNRKLGNIIAIIAGLIAIIGMFVPILVVYPLVMSLFYIDPFLILIGGIIGIVISE